MGHRTRRPIIAALALIGILFSVRLSQNQFKCRAGRPVLIVLLLVVALSSRTSFAVGDGVGDVADATSFVVAAQASTAPNESWFAFHLAVPEGESIPGQYVYQEILAQMLRNARSLGFAQCSPAVVPGVLFGDFVLVVRHPIPARRLECLRAGIAFLLRQSVRELDFENSKFTAHLRQAGYARDAIAQQLALRTIYEKFSPLQQMHAVERRDFSELSFEKFDAWLRRTRELKLITFNGKTSLLELLNVPIPDPMILQLVASTKSSRVPAGVLFFDGDSVGVSSIIMVSVDPHEPNPVDKEVVDRLSCGPPKQSRPRIASAGNAISDVTCSTFDWFGDVWLSLAITKSGDTSYPDFCRQVRELTDDTDVAALMRSGPEGLKGAYILLPLKCQAQE